jgi:hypothetical protein
VPAAGERSWEIADKLLGRLDGESIAHDLLGQLTDLLHRGLTYLGFLGQINSDDDGTYGSRPSIDDHAQNNRFVIGPSTFICCAKSGSVLHVTTPHERAPK